MKIPKVSGDVEIEFTNGSKITISKEQYNAEINRQIEAKKMLEDLKNLLPDDWLDP